MFISDDALKECINWRYSDGVSGDQWNEAARNVKKAEGEI